MAGHKAFTMTTENPSILPSKIAVGTTPRIQG